MMRMAIIALALTLSACGTAPPKATLQPTPTKSGGYYQDDGPGDAAPTDLNAIADALPRAEKFHSGANKPYTVFGRSYVPVVNNEPFRQHGIASWYGRKFHGNMTSIGERYDMYAMTAAHPTLPLPCYVRVTNPANQRSVVVRVNDRGPFHADRIIDLSYTAAAKLDLARRGSAPVSVERVFAGESATATSANVAARPTPSAPTAVVVSPLIRDSGGLFLQLGAFGSQENADIFNARMRRELAWHREPPTTIFNAGLWRVRLGPYATRVEAEAIADRIRTMHDFSPVISKNQP